jgi:hypothetical protein
MRSTIGQLKEFKTSFIYLDMMEELDIWLDDIQHQFEFQGHPEAQLRVLQGNAEFARKVKGMIDQFIRNQEDDVDESDKDQLEKELDEDVEYLPSSESMKDDNDTLY